MLYIPFFVVVFVVSFLGSLTHNTMMSAEESASQSCVECLSSQDPSSLERANADQRVHSYCRPVKPTRLCCVCLSAADGLKIRKHGNAWIHIYCKQRLGTKQE